MIGHGVAVTEPDLVVPHLHVLVPLHTAGRLLSTLKLQDSTPTQHKRLKVNTRTLSQGKNIKHYIFKLNSFKTIKILNFAILTTFSETLQFIMKIKTYLSLLRVIIGMSFSVYLC